MDAAPDVQTVFLLSEPRNIFISSSLVREIAGHGGDVSRYLPPEAHRALLAALATDQIRTPGWGCGSYRCGQGTAKAGSRPEQRLPGTGRHCGGHMCGIIGYTGSRQHSFSKGSAAWNWATIQPVSQFTTHADCTASCRGAGGRPCRHRANRPFRDDRHRAHLWATHGGVTLENAHPHRICSSVSRWSTTASSRTWAL